MIYGERTHRSAFCIGTNGSVAPLTRTPFMSGNFNEAWLQALLEDNPAVIPAADVSLEYRDLVCIGREVPVGSGETQGYIDNLYVTPSVQLHLPQMRSGAPDHRPDDGEGVAIFFG